MQEATFIGKMYLVISYLLTIPLVSDILYPRTNMKFTRTLLVRVFLFKKIPKKEKDINDLNLNKEKEQSHLSTKCREKKLNNHVII